MNEAMWREIQKSQQEIQVLETDLGKRNAYRYDFNY